MVHDHELPAVDERGVGLAARDADLERLGGEPFRLVGLTVDDRDPREPERVDPGEHGLVQPFRQPTHDLGAAVHLADVTGLGARLPAPVRREELQHRIAEALGSDEPVGRPGERLLEHRRRHERVRHVVQDADDDRIVGGAFRDRQGLVGQRPPALEGAPDHDLEAVGREDQCAIGIVAGDACEGLLEDGDPVGVDGTEVAEQPPVCCERGGNEARSVTVFDRTSGCAQKGVAKGGLAQLALGGAEPDLEVDGQDRIVLVALREQLEGVRVVAQRVRGREAVERGVPGLP